MYKPILLLGNGLRRNPALVAHLASLGIPTLTTWMFADAIPEDSPVFCGRPGIIGQRAANIVVQKASELWCFGARLDGETVGWNYDTFAPKSIIHVHDVDGAELAKLPDRYQKHQLDLTHANVQGLPTGDPAWLSWCKALYARFRGELDAQHCEHPYCCDPYRFLAELSNLCKPDDVLAIGSSGYAPVSFLQAFKVKAGQRISNCSTIGAMGADIPMAIGACIGSGKRRTFCVTGDGGFQLNVQELEVVKRLHLPIKFIVYNNQGYGSIRTMQQTRFGRTLGADPDSGFTLPRLHDIAYTYEIAHAVLYRDSYLPFDLLDNRNPAILELMVDPGWCPMPKVMSSMQGGRMLPDAFEDMTPKLPEKELAEIMRWGD